jgi:hypothetical protein
MIGVAMYQCRACGKPLLPESSGVADGCPCNAPRGVNHGIVPVNVCTCVECDPAQTGAVRKREPARAESHTAPRPAKYPPDTEYE